jgi:hypothetical protein
VESHRSCRTFQHDCLKKPIMWARTITADRFLRFRKLQKLTGFWSILYAEHCHFNGIGTEFAPSAVETTCRAISERAPGLGEYAMPAVTLSPSFRIVRRKCLGPLDSRVQLVRRPSLLDLQVTGDAWIETCSHDWLVVFLGSYPLGSLRGTTMDRVALNQRFFQVRSRYPRRGPFKSCPRECQEKRPGPAE